MQYILREIVCKISFEGAYPSEMHRRASNEKRLEVKT